MQNLHESAEMIDDPAYFRCEKLSCILRKKICVERQIMTRQGLHPSMQFPQCKDCGQGAEIREAVKLGGCEAGKKIISKKEKPIMGATSIETPPEKQKTIVMCKDCETRPAAINRKTGKPTNGLCGYCRSKKARERKQRRLDKLKKRGAGETVKKKIMKMRGCEGVESSISISLDLTRYPQLLDIISELSEKFRVPMDHVVISLLAEALATKTAKEEKNV